MIRRKVLSVALATIAIAGVTTFGGGNPLIGAAHAAGEDPAPIDTSTIPDMVLGNPDAPVEVIEYASFTCPHCAKFHEGPFKQLKAEYIDTGKVKFVYREVYFDRFGLWASMIARCAGPDKFFGIADLLYEGQSTWMRAGGPTEIVSALRKIGRLAGMDGAALDTCLQDNDKARTLVAWYQENATRDNIDGTPTFIIDGKKVTNRAYSDFKAVIDAELGS